LQCHAFSLVRIDLPESNYPVEENFDLHNDRALIEQIAPFYDMGLWSLIQSLGQPSSSQNALVHCLTQNAPVIVRCNEIGALLEARESICTGT
jgi:hypothetical protein